MTRDLIVFGEDWGGLPSSTQHLVHHLSKSRKVVWVNSIGLRRPNLAWRDIKRAWAKVTASKGSECGGQHKPLNDDFHVVHPRTLPAPRSRVERRMARSLLAAQIRPVIRNTGLQSPILWTSLPTAVDISGHLDETALVYYCGDDFSALAGVDHATVARRESELVAKADLVLAASKKLAERFPSGRTRLLPHGVDYRLFSTPAPRAKDLPDDGHPIAGFYGSISEWLDLELLQACIARMPHWQFVFIGKPVVDTRALSRFPNVVLLGERPHEQLPSYIQHWTASLLPFKDNPQIQACNPLKLREYLAAGRPIVSTSFPAVTPYQQHIHIATDADGMVAALHESTTTTDTGSQRDVVSGETWTARATQVSEWLDAL
ncbi:MAG: glycosyltransferase family 1 protein [Gammaproteobacteria bacterium]|nr:glycosyltransferase family 1 protein [Gammaproteobacteria bacterium]